MKKRYRGKQRSALKRVQRTCEKGKAHADERVMSCSNKQKVSVGREIYKLDKIHHRATMMLHENEGE